MSNSRQRLIEAAERGDTQAQFELACSYLDEPDETSHYKEAVRLFQRAKEHNDPNGIFVIGHPIVNDHSYLFADKQKGYAEAVKWCRKAAEQDHVKAQLVLGRFYFDGVGVEQNLAEAAMLFRRAAAQGDATAQYNLGFMCFFGLGVQRSYEEAAMWFRRSSR